MVVLRLLRLRLVLIIGTSFCFLGTINAYKTDSAQTDAVQQVVLKNGNVDAQIPLVPVVVIGSGPAGLSAALYTARHKLDTIVLSGNEPGGQLVGSRRVENMPGVLADEGYHIMDKLREQAESFGVRCIDDALSAIVRSVDGSSFTLTTQGGMMIRATAVIVSTGASALLLGVSGEQTYRNRGVYTCAVCECRQMEGKEVVVVGGGDAALEAVMFLAPYASKITVLVRKGKMRASECMQEKLERYAHVVVMYHTDLIKVEGDGKVATSVLVKNNQTDEKRVLFADGVFECIGHKPNSEKFLSLLAVDDAGYIQLSGRSQKTSCGGIFAAGDVADPVYRQAGVAAGDGIKAGLDAVAYLQAHATT